jgi:transforming growth factor-beta-induced protein
MLDRRSAMTLAVCLLGFSGGRLQAGPPPAPHDAPYAGKSVVYRAASTGRAGLFVSAVWTSGLTDALRGGGPYTVFVPTDEAFARLPEATRLALLRPEGEEKLAEILKYHVIKGRILAAEITADPHPATLAGPPLTIAASKAGVAVNEATVVTTDLTCRNGVVHLIDRVLMPPADGVLDAAKEAGNFRVLLRAIEAAGLSGTLAGEGPFTVPAPTDEAFAGLGEGAIEGLLKDKPKLAAILRNHVIPGKLTARELAARTDVPTLLKAPVRPDIKAGRLVVKRSNVVAGDIEASDGIIHAIDAVLIPGHD